MIVDVVEVGGADAIEDADGDADEKLGDEEHDDRADEKLLIENLARLFILISHL